MLINFNDQAVSQVKECNWDGILSKLETKVSGVADILSIPTSFTILHLLLGINQYHKILNKIYDKPSHHQPV